MDLETRIKQLEAENSRLKRQLELATVANGRTKNIKHLLVLTAGDVKDDGFYFKGESGLSADAYFERLRQHPDFSPLMGSNGTKTTDGNPWSKESFNLTKQMQLTRENPSLAAELKKQAKG